MKALDIIVKISLSIMLLGCLLKVPYGYFQFVRLASCAGFTYLCYIEFCKERIITGTLCLGSAILLNPFIKVHLKRHTWNNIDIALAVGLLVWVVVDIAILLTKKK